MYMSNVAVELEMASTLPLWSFHLQPTFVSKWFEPLTFNMLHGVSAHNMWNGVQSVRYFNIDGTIPCAVKFDRL